MSHPRWSRRHSPKLHVTVRKAFGFGSSIMAMNPFDSQTISLSFPAITLAALAPSVGAASAKLTEEERPRSRPNSRPPRSAAPARMGYDDVIDPRQLRNALLHGLTLSEGRAEGPFAPIAHVGIQPSCEPALLTYRNGRT